MNDPNGPIFFRGRYHMFHQYNPRGAVWGNMNWAHATSLDMIHWQHEPIALSPTPDGPDRAGVFSGSAVLDNGTPTVIYTGVAPPASDAAATLRDGTHTWRETQCLAVAQDNDLRTWKKLPEPVIATPPAGLAVTGFRDPYVWREGNNWMLILGSGVAHKGGTILLYTSPDLRHWTYLHPLVEGVPSEHKSTNPVDTGEMWECPDFFPLGNKQVLLISTMGKVRWKVGTYSNQRFTPEKEGVVDWGSYYAAKTTRDADGNLILWGWIPETRPDADLTAAGWAGAMSLPRTLSLNSENELQTEVSPAAVRLRTAHTSITGETDLSARQKLLDTLRITDLAAELQLTFRPKSRRDFRSSANRERRELRHHLLRQQVRKARTAREPHHRATRRIAGSTCISARLPRRIGARALRQRNDISLGTDLSDSLRPTAAENRRRCRTPLSLRMATHAHLQRPPHRILMRGRFEIDALSKSLSPPAYSQSFPVPPRANTPPLHLPSTKSDQNVRPPERGKR